jgi:hypothetical protein
VHEDPAQRELRHRRALGNQRAQLLHRVEPDIERHARKRLAEVECLAAAVEVAVVVGAEGRLARVAAGQQPRRQRHPCDDPNLPAGDLGEEQLRGRRRNALKMIWTDATPWYSIAFSPSSTRSTLTP